jgi:hypothetical protein
MFEIGEKFHIGTVHGLWNMRAKYTLSQTKKLCLDLIQMSLIDGHNKEIQTLRFHDVIYSHGRQKLGTDAAETLRDNLSDSFINNGYYGLDKSIQWLIHSNATRKHKWSQGDGYTERTILDIAAFHIKRKNPNFEIDDFANLLSGKFDSNKCSRYIDFFFKRCLSCNSWCAEEDNKAGLNTLNHTDHAFPDRIEKFQLPGKGRELVLGVPDTDEARRKFDNFKIKNNLLSGIIRHAPLCQECASEHKFNCRTHGSQKIIIENFKLLGCLECQVEHQHDILKMTTPPCISCGSEYSHQFNYAGFDMNYAGFNINYAGFDIKKDVSHIYPERIEELTLDGIKGEDHLCTLCVKKMHFECKTHGPQLFEPYYYPIFHCNECLIDYYFEEGGK